MAPSSSRSQRWLYRLSPPMIRGRSAPAIFVSYRRKGPGSGYALALFDRLRGLIGGSRVFLDVAEGAIELGEDWRARLDETVRQCGYLVAFIDPGWPDRLSEPNDPVRFELETALEAGVTIIPILVSGAQMPEEGALPESLRGIPALNAHRIRAESSTADLDNLIAKLLPGVPLQESYLDGIDYALLAGTVAAGLLMWGSWGRSMLNTTEYWLWGSALVLVALFTLLARRIFRWKRGAKFVGWRPVRPWAAALAPGLVIWMYAAFHVYEVPSFPEDSVGIFVARFGGDPHDRYQRLFEKSLGDVISEKRLGERHQLVKALPRRIHSAAEARRLGADAGAAAVLWGNLFDDAFASEPALEAKVTFAAAAGFFDEAGDAPIKGAEALSSGARNLSISGELGTLQSVLPLLLAGYRVYHSAADTIGYLRASTYFDSTLARMESIQTRDASSPIKAVLATVHFYLGNTHYVLGDVERAEDSYRKAIELSQGTEGGIRPEYVEPLSNLGHLLSDQKRYEDAVAVLARADVQCSVDTTTPVCAYAFYNHGSALLELADYRDALARFRRAAERIESAGARGDADTAEYRLAAYARQNTAYSAVKLAGETGDSELLDRAQREWEMGAKLMEERVGEQVPDRFRITLARIHIQRREWDQARDLLSRLQRAGLAEPTLFALLAGVNWCMGDTPAFGLAMQRLQSATAHDAAARAAAFREQKTILELCDRKEAEP